jgi:hypothetical protein
MTKMSEQTFDQSAPPIYEQDDLFLGDVMPQDYLPDSITITPEQVAENRRLVQARYEEFKPDVESLVREVSADPEKMTEHTLSAEGTKMRTLILGHANEKYVLRVPQKHGAAYDNGPRVEGAIRCLGVDGMEQAVAVSADESDFVSQIVPGKTIRNLDTDEQRRILNEHLAELVATIVIAKARGINLDTFQENTLYSKQHGFGLVDYVYEPHLLHSLERTLVEVGTSLVSMGSSTRPIFRGPEERAEETRVGRDILERYRDMCMLALPDDEARQKVEAGINVHLGPVRRSDVGTAALDAADVRLQS